MVKQSALLDLYRSRGATLVEHEHWLLPAHFGDPLAEYHAVRNGVGMLDLCQRNLLRFHGDNRTSLLNDIVSNDVNALTTGKGLHAAFLDLHGKVLADARIFAQPISLLLTFPSPAKKPYSSICDGIARLRKLKSKISSLILRCYHCKAPMPNGSSPRPRLRMAYLQAIWFTCKSRLPTAM